MRVYLAAAMTNPDRDVGAIKAVRAHIEDLGHEVLTPHVAAEDGVARDTALTPGALAQRDLGLLASGDALVAEVSAPSHGVGIEVLAATRAGLPTLVLHRRGVRVSRLLLGLPGIQVATYQCAAEIQEAVADFLAPRSGIAGHPTQADLSSSGQPSHPTTSR